MFSSWPAKSEGGRAAVAKKRVSPRAPPGGGGSIRPSAALTTLSGLLAPGKEPPPPLGGQRFYATRSPNSRTNPGHGAAGSRSAVPGSGGPDQGFLLRF